MSVLSKILDKLYGSIHYQPKSKLQKFKLYFEEIQTPGEWKKSIRERITDFRKSIRRKK